MALAALEGFQSVEHLKRYTTLGMGTDQGKLANVNTLGILSELRALSSQARLSALVLAAAPVAFALLSAAADPRTTTFLFVDGAGRLCLVAGFTLDLGGAVWMARITRAAAP